MRAGRTYAVKRKYRPPDDPARAKTCARCGRRFEKDRRNTWAYWERAKFCGQECASLAWSERAAERRPPIEDAFSRWVDKSGECWEWTGARDKNGYGIFSYEGKSRRAAIVALELDGRRPGPGMFACHTCDNPPCVRPDHLYPGTPAHNMADAIARDRTCRGERQHAAKLRDADILLIRVSKETDEALAAKFGVSRSNISMIRCRKTWKHLP